MKIDFKWPILSSDAFSTHSRKYGRFIIIIISLGAAGVCFLINKLFNYYIKNTQKHDNNIEERVKSWANPPPISVGDVLENTQGENLSLTFQTVPSELADPDLNSNPFLDAINSCKIFNLEAKITVSDEDSAQEYSSFLQLAQSSNSVDKLKYLKICGRIESNYLDFSYFKSLKTLDLSECRDFTDLPECITDLTTLETLNLNGYANFRSLPESIGKLKHLKSLDLSGNKRLTGLPSSILSLSHECKINIDGCCFSYYVLSRLYSSTHSPDYKGPQFLNLKKPDKLEKRSFLNTTINHLYDIGWQERTNFSRELSENKEYNYKDLGSWLSRLSWAAEGGIDRVSLYRSEHFYKIILVNLELVGSIPQFATLFWKEVEEGLKISEDRIVLSVLHLQVFQELVKIQDESLKAVWAVLKKAWTIDLLGDCADQKIKEVPFYNPIEIYLGYPFFLGKQLNLFLGVEEMLFDPRYDTLSREDLEEAKNYVTKKWEDKDAACDYLIKQTYWLKTLSKHYSEEVRSIESLKELGVNPSAEESEKVDSQVKKQYKELSLKALEAAS